MADTWAKSLRALSRAVEAANVEAAAKATEQTASLEALAQAVLDGRARLEPEYPEQANMPAAWRVLVDDAPATAPENPDFDALAEAWDKGFREGRRTHPQAANPYRDLPGGTLYGIRVKGFSSHIAVETLTEAREWARDKRRWGASGPREILTFARSDWNQVTVIEEVE